MRCVELNFDPNASKNSIQLHFSGIEIPGNEADNLCVKAYHLLAEEQDLPGLKGQLHKVIPIGAGLGEEVLIVLFAVELIHRMCQLNLPLAKRLEIAGKLGSDCPFFIENMPAYVTGRGEVLKTIDLSLSGMFIALVNPNIHIGTAEAYAGVNPQPSKFDLVSVLKQQPLAEWKNLVKNDFEDSVFPKYPVIKSIKEDLYALGAEYAA